jgi:hypothetical protein
VVVWVLVGVSCGGSFCSVRGGHLVSDGFERDVIPLAAFLRLHSLLSAGCSLPQLVHMSCGHCITTRIVVVTILERDRTMSREIEGR